jgi:hypothetical protein
MTPKRPQMAPDQRPPETLPDPWLFDTEALIRELDRCRELVLLIPARTNEVHLASNTAIGALWSLREQIRHPARNPLRRPAPMATPRRYGPFQASETAPRLAD